MGKNKGNNCQQGGGGRARLQISQKTDLPKEWNDKDWSLYKELMLLAFADEDLADVETGLLKRSTLTVETLAKFAKQQIRLKRMSLGTLDPDLAPRVMLMKTGAEK